MTFVDSSTIGGEAYIQQVLDEYGLGSLAGWAWNLIVQGATETEMLQQLRQRPEYQARFPYMAERQARNLPAISEAEAIAYERQAIGLFRAAGLPEGFYDQPSDFTELIGQDVSVAELSQRVKMAEDAVYNEPPETLDFYREFGLGDGDFVAAILDADRALPLIQRKVNAARIAGTGRRTGFGDLTESEATGLVTQGVTQEQAQQGLGDLARGRELFTPMDRGEDLISREDQLAATFSDNADAKAKIENRQKRRTNEFAKGGGFAAGRQGYSGLG